jgi:hypothetical protein
MANVGAGRGRQIEKWSSKVGWSGSTSGERIGATRPANASETLLSVPQLCPRDIFIILFIPFYYRSLFLLFSCFLSFFLPFFLSFFLSFSLFCFSIRALYPDRDSLYGTTNIKFFIITSVLMRPSKQ